MNERIRELESQCKVFVDYYDHRLCVVHSEKFAELIIQECANIANAHMVECEDINYGVGTKIKRHFGVK